MAASTLGLALRAVTPAVVHGESLGWAYFDGPGGTQMIDAAIEETAHFSRSGLANRGANSPAGEYTELVMAAARREVQHLFLAQDYEVVFGQNMTSLAFSLGRALVRRWGRDGGVIVTTELDHAANVYPWATAFADRGVRRFSVTADEKTFDLDVASLDQVDTAEGVALVAVTGAANSVGVKPDLAALRSYARAHDALFVVDGVHVTSHEPPDLSVLDADVYLCSAYKFYGPHVGVGLVKKSLAQDLRPDKVRPAPDTGAEKFETGTQNHEAIAGVLATLCGLGRLVGRADGTGARDALWALDEVEMGHARALADGARAISGVRVFGHEPGSDRFVATVALTVDGVHSDVVGHKLRERGMAVGCGDFYADQLARRLGISESGGWVRAGIAGYTTAQEVEQLVAALEEIAAGR